MLNFKKWLNEAGGDNPMAEPVQDKGATINPGGFVQGKVPDPDDEETTDDKPPAERKTGADRLKMKRKMKK